MDQNLRTKFANIKASGGRSDNIVDGWGVLIVKKIEYKNLEAGGTFIVEAVVESSNKATGLTDLAGNPVDVAPNTPGSTIGYIQQVDRFKSAFGNVKAFVLNLLGESLETSDDKFFPAFEALCGAPNPARGMRVAYRTKRQVTKDKSKKNTYPYFEHVKQTPEQVKATRAELDGAETAA